MKEEPLILEIKDNSLDDGSGIRIVIFLKGCPLACLWCHNLEIGLNSNLTCGTSIWGKSDAFDTDFQPILMEIKNVGCFKV